jgi:hypothetical protein
MDETVQAFEELVEALEGDEFSDLFGDLTSTDIEEVAVMQLHINEWIEARKMGDSQREETIKEKYTE